MDTERTAGLTRFNLQCSASLFDEGSGRAARPTAAYYSRRFHHRVAPRRLHERRGAAGRGGRRAPGRPASVGTARTVTPASRSPSAGGDVLAPTRATQAKTASTTSSPRSRRTCCSWRGRARATTTARGQGDVTCYVKSAPRRRRGPDSKMLERGRAPCAHPGRPAERVTARAPHRGPPPAGARARAPKRPAADNVATLSGERAKRASAPPGLPGTRCAATAIP